MRQHHSPSISVIFSAVLIILSGCSSDGDGDAVDDFDSQFMEDGESTNTAAPDSIPVVDVSIEQPPEQPAEQPAEQPPEQSPEQPAEQPAEQPPEQSPEQPAEQPPEQSPEQPAEQPPEQPVEPSLVELGVPVFNENISDSITRFTEVLEEVIAESLVEMNQRLQTGEALSSIQSTCLGAFDPAVGEALLALDCNAEQLPLSVPVFSLLLSEGVMAGTRDCNNGLLELNADTCRLVSADLLMPIEWTTPEVGLPRPYTSGTMEYNLTANQLRIFSLENNTVTPPYDCTYDLSQATIDSAVLFGSCDDQLDSLRDRLQAWLDRRA